MGFNIAGIVINKNYSDSLHELEKKIGSPLKEIKEINFEEAVSNWKDENIFDIYFSTKGTLIFTDLGFDMQEWALKEVNTLTFILADSSDTSLFYYYENGNQIRKIIETDGERVADFGDELEIEKRCTDNSTLIWNLIEEILGKSFWSIGNNEKATRYKFI